MPDEGPSNDGLLSGIALVLVIIVIVAVLELTNTIDFF